MMKRKRGMAGLLQALSRRQFVQGTAAVGLSVTAMPTFASAEEEKKLNFYNWDTYIGEDTLGNFQEATGIVPRMDLFADNDELFAKLKDGNPGYDVIVPTNDYVERMIVAGMLEKLDHDRIPNFANVAEPFQDEEFDPGRGYSMPYMWGTIAMGYRISEVENGEAPASWAAIYDSDQYAGRTSLLGDAQNVIGHALKYLGYSLNSTNAAEVKQAEELIIANKKNIKVFADDNGQDLLASGEVDLAQEWNGDILQVMEEDDDISLTVPQEGGLLWQDCLCIPTGAPHPGNAHEFINFILDAEEGKDIAEYIYYATPNAAAKAIADPEYSENPAIFPSDEILAKCEVATFKGAEAVRMYDEAWTRINAA